MRTLTCMIVDDEPLAVKMLESYVSRTPGLEAVAALNDPVEALARLKEEPVDLLFLDIQMPDLDGLSLAQMLPPGTRVVFTTAFKEYALESYDVSALDFLLKPIRYQKFLKAVDKARDWFQLADAQQEPATKQVAVGDTRGTVYVRLDGALRQVDLNRILYVEGMKDYVRIHLVDEPRPLITHATMKNWEDVLPANAFMRVHRSFIVALDKIRSVDRNSCIYIGQEVIRVTDAYRDAFDAYLKKNLL